MANAGTIKRLVADRGFGFISGDDGTEYFFHRSAVADFDALQPGNQVTFVVETGDRGPRAGQIKVTSGE